MNVLILPFENVLVLDLSFEIGGTAGTLLLLPPDEQRMHRDRWNNGFALHDPISERDIFGGYKLAIWDDDCDLEPGLTCCASAQRPCMVLRRGRV